VGTLTPVLPLTSHTLKVARLASGPVRVPAGTVHPRVGAPFPSERVLSLFSRAPGVLCAFVSPVRVSLAVPGECGLVFARRGIVLVWLLRQKAVSYRQESSLVLGWEFRPDEVLEEFFQIPPDDPAHDDAYDEVHERERGGEDTWVGEDQEERGCQRLRRKPGEGMCQLIEDVNVRPHISEALPGLEDAVLGHAVADRPLAGTKKAEVLTPAGMESLCSAARASSINRLAPW
jgi:hypothetical protein